ncbi:MAG: hypothetical protein AB7K04_17370, partial [Pseudorhodoplanes sp.]
MASLVLTTVGAAAGGALFGPVGAFAGRLVGAVAGSFVDGALLGNNRAPAAPREGPRLRDLDVMVSTEGAPIPRVYGRVRLSGQVIWATALEERVSTQGGGDGGGKGAPEPASSGTSVKTYRYFANFAVGLCEGPIGHVARVWADGKPLDLKAVNFRLHRGSED